MMSKCAEGEWERIPQARNPALQPAGEAGVWDPQNGWGWEWIPHVRSQARAQLHPAQEALRNALANASRLIRAQADTLGNLWICWGHSTGYAVAGSSGQSPPEAVLLAGSAICNACEKTWGLSLFEPPRLAWVDELARVVEELPRHRAAVRAICSTLSGANRRRPRPATSKPKRCKGRPSALDLQAVTEACDLVFQALQGLHLTYLDIRAEQRRVSEQSFGVPLSAFEEGAVLPGDASTGEPQGPSAPYRSQPVTGTVAVIDPSEVSSAEGGVSLPMESYPQVMDAVRHRVRSETLREAMEVAATAAAESVRKAKAESPAAAPPTDPSKASGAEGTVAVESALTVAPPVAAPPTDPSEVSSAEGTVAAESALTVAPPAATLPTESERGPDSPTNLNELPLKSRLVALLAQKPWADAKTLAKDLGVSRQALYKVGLKGLRVAVQAGNRGRLRDQVQGEAVASPEEE